MKARQGISATTNQHMAAPFNKVPKVSRRNVSCPDCHAAIGEQCVSATGQVKAGWHRARVRLSMRAYQEASE